MTAPQDHDRTAARAHPERWAGGMLGVASLAVELARPNTSTGAAIGWTALGIALMLAARLALRWRPAAARAPKADRWLVPLIAALATIPAIAFPAAPLEYHLVAGMRNAMLGLFLFRSGAAASCLSCFLSLFLLMVAASSIGEPLRTALVGAYAGLGVAWMWQSAAVPSAGDRGFLAAPGFRTGLTLSALVVGVVGVTARYVGEGRGLYSLEGVVRSSGGVKESSDEARSGVGDGADEVTGSRDAHDVGFDNSDVFLNSDKPGLYDAFIERYGEAAKSHQSVKLQGLRRAQITTSEAEGREDLRHGAEFSLLRKGASSPASKAVTHDAAALMWVKTGVPVYIPLATYDRFDGESWREARYVSGRLPLEADPNRGWFSVAGRSRFAGTGGTAESFQVKIGRLDSAILPVPGNTSAVRVGRVTRADLFAPAQDGLLRLIGRPLPAGTVIDAEYQLVNPDGHDPAMDFERREAPPGTPPALRRIAQAWTQGISAGLPQVEVVVARLRGRELTIPALESDAGARPVIGFLSDTAVAAAEDYHYASAAALLLQAKGYAVRLASGFYVDPAHAEARSGYVPVNAGNVHFWVEARLIDGRWVTLEPTPGYRLPSAGPSLFGRSVALLFRIRHWGAAHAVGLSMIPLFAVAAWLVRRPVADNVLTLLWRLQCRLDPSRYTVRTLRLVQRRSQLAGVVARPPAMSLRRWLIMFTPDHMAVQEFANAVDSALYGSLAATKEIQDERTMRLCREVEAMLTFRHLKSHAARAAAHGWRPNDSN